MTSLKKYFTSILKNNTTSFTECPFLPPFPKKYKIGQNPRDADATKADSPTQASVGHATRGLSKRCFVESNYGANRKRYSANRTNSIDVQYRGTFSTFLRNLKPVSCIQDFQECYFSEHISIIEQFSVQKRYRALHRLVTAESSPALANKTIFHYFMCNSQYLIQLVTKKPTFNWPVVQNNAP